MVMHAEDNRYVTAVLPRQPSLTPGMLLLNQLQVVTSLSGNRGAQDERCLVVNMWSVMMLLVQLKYLWLCTVCKMCTQ